MAFNPALGKLVNIETSTDANYWKDRETRFRRKFEPVEKHFHALFKCLSLPSHHDKIPMFGLGGRQNHETIGGGMVVLLGDLLVEIVEKLKDRTWFSNAVPEGFPILRTLQVVMTYKKAAFDRLPGDGVTLSESR